MKPTDVNVKKVVAELRAFVAELQKRNDIQVTVANLGGKAASDEVERVRRLYPDLADFYAEMNGIHVEWSFVEPSGGGCMRVPPISQWTVFAGDDQTYMGFGDDQEALLLDEIQPEGGTWLVRSKTNEKDVRIVFASGAEGAEGIEPAATLAEYFREAMKNGFVYYWPRCFRENPYVTYAAQEEAIERFRAEPVAPTKIEPGVRVEVSYFSEGGRGQALALHTAPPSRTTDFCGTELVQVKLDEGSTAWFPLKWMKAVNEEDAYERMRNPDIDIAALATADALGTFADVARAIGPMTYSKSENVGLMANNGRRAAGLLSERSLQAAINSVLALRKAAIEAEINADDHHDLQKNGDEFSASEFSTVRWQHSIGGTLTGLFSGLVVLVYHESSQRQVAPSSLVHEETLQRLGRIPEASALHATLEGEGPLPSPTWHSSDKAEELGLPADAVVLLGTGF